MADVFIQCADEPSIYIPETECDECEEYLNRLEEKMDAFEVGDGLELENGVMSALRNPDNTYTKDEVDAIVGGVIPESEYYTREVLFQDNIVIEPFGAVAITGPDVDQTITVGGVQYGLVSPMPYHYRIHNSTVDGDGSSFVIPSNVQSHYVYLHNTHQTHECHVQVKFYYLYQRFQTQ